MPLDAAGGLQSSSQGGVPSNQALQAQYPADTRWFAFWYGADSLKPFRDNDCQVCKGKLVS